MSSYFWSYIDALSYIASYPDLIRAFGADSLAGRDHYDRTGEAEGRTIRFQPLTYTAAHPDLIRAFGTDEFLSVRHFIQYGFAEGRAASFDADAYLAANPDVLRVHGTDPIAAARHYIEHGLAEGRRTSFDAYGYLAANPDLIADYIDDLAGATRHYVEQGYDEGRTGRFDGLRYIASYADLMAAFGTDAQTGARHFALYGYAEGRSISFDPFAYLLAQPDLLRAGFTVAQAMVHWIEYGHAERGRHLDDGFGSDQVDHALPFLQQTSGQIDHPGDRDWHQITLEKAAAISLTISGGEDLHVTLHDSRGTIVGSADGALSTLQFATPTAGTYYLVVSGQVAGHYTIVLDTVRDIITGTAGDDYLYGTEADEILMGLDGDDQLTDYADGHDQLFGGDGDDTLYVSVNEGVPARNILLDGGAGDDLLTFYSWRYYRSGPTKIDTVVAIGGDGDDRIELRGMKTAIIDAGAGNDWVSLDSNGGAQRITLGAGWDIASFGSGSYSAENLHDIRIADFTIGEDILLFDYWLDYLRDSGWDGVSNPFATGYLRLSQVGEDAILSISFGPATSEDSFYPFITFENSLASNFTARELEFNPDGSPTVGIMLTGTDDDDLLYGADGDDHVLGLAGDDQIMGRGGNDLIDGGAGDDALNGGLGDDILYGGDGDDRLIDYKGGNDQLYGQDGDDSLIIDGYFPEDPPARTLLLDGGAGNDRIEVWWQTSFYPERELDHVTMRGGDGDDVILADGLAFGDIDAGAGNDSLTLDYTSDMTITLGAGEDVLTLSGYREFWREGFADLRITDFTISEDRLDMVSALSWESVLQNGANPFAIGTARLVQSGADTLLQLKDIGLGGGPQAWNTFLTFENRVATRFTEAELGYVPTVVALAVGTEAMVIA